MYFFTGLKVNDIMFHYNNKIHKDYYFLEMTKVSK